MCPDGRHDPQGIYRALLFPCGCPTVAVHTFRQSQKRGDECEKDLDPHGKDDTTKPLKSQEGRATIPCFFAAFRAVLSLKIIRMNMNGQALCAVTRKKFLKNSKEGEKIKKLTTI